jgi:hypothetical protein
MRVLLQSLSLQNLSPLTQFLVTSCVSATFIGCLATLFLFAWFGKEFPPGLKEVLILLIGALVNEFKTVTSFWLGTSAGSAKKTDLLAGGSKDATQS